DMDQHPDTDQVLELLVIFAHTSDVDHALHAAEISDRQICLSVLDRRYPARNAKAHEATPNSRRRKPCRRDRGLTKGQAAVIRRNLSMKKNPKSRCLQAAGDLLNQRAVLEAASRERNLAWSARVVPRQPRGHRRDSLGESAMEAQRDVGWWLPASQVTAEKPPHRGGIEALPVRDRKAVGALIHGGLIARLSSHRLEPHCGFALVV